MVGLDKGVKLLSDLTIITTLVLLVFIVIAEPTQFIFDSFVENIGNYAGNIVTLAL